MSGDELTTAAFGFAFIGLCWIIKALRAERRAAVMLAIADRQSRDAHAMMDQTQEAIRELNEFVGLWSIGMVDEAYQLLVETGWKVGNGQKV